MRLTSSKIFKSVFIFFSLCVLLSLLAGCGVDSGDSDDSGNSSSDTGSIAFSLVFNGGNFQSQFNSAAAATGDVCVDHGIETVIGKVYNSSNAQVASASVQCSEHELRITCPAGSGMRLVLEGTASGSVAWSGEEAGITVSAGSTYNATVTMNQVIFNAEIQKLKSDDLTPVDYFGREVAISGDYAIVGAGEKDHSDFFQAGAAYIFSRNLGGTDGWGQVRRLTAELDAQTNAYFGETVSISGDYVIAGARSETVTGHSYAGAAYIFSRNQGGTDGWGQVKKLTRSDVQSSTWFGISVSISGDHAIVGAYGEMQSGYSNAGAAYIFSRNRNGSNQWGQVARLNASFPNNDAFFGGSVSISGDYAIVGAHYENSSGNSRAGAVYIFSRNQNGSNQWGQVARLTEPTPVATNYFGDSVSISGDYAIVGATFGDSLFSNTGAAYIFHREPNGWVQVKKITASYAQVGDYFGYTVAISGDYAIVGAYGENDLTGAVYIFYRNEGGIDNWGEFSKLTASDAAADAFFGNSVAISGKNAIVAAEQDSAVQYRGGAAYIY